MSRVDHVRKVELLQHRSYSTVPARAQRDVSDVALHCILSG
jgi:hypothetical protein